MITKLHFDILPMRNMTFKELRRLMNALTKLNDWDFTIKFGGFNLWSDNRSEEK